jgi:hypothetical protein
LIKAAARQRLEAAANGPGIDFGDEAAFADSGFTANQDTASGATLNRGQSGIEISHFFLAPDE